MQPALLVDAEQLAKLPARDPRPAPRPGQHRPGVDRQLDPRDGPVGFGKIGGGDARGEPRGDRGPAQPDHRRGRGIGAQHAHQVDAIGRLRRKPDPPARARPGRGDAASART
jgi:hypothetical protein